MTITLLQENLFPKLQDALRFISNKPQLPILSGIYISAENGEVLLRSTDLKVGFQTKIGGKIEEEGACVVPARYFEELIGSLVAGPISLKANEQTLFIEQGKVKAKLSLFPASDFPPFPSLGTEVLSVDRKKFLASIEMCQYASSPDESRPVLASMLIAFEEEVCTVAATDGYRLAVSTFAIDSEVPATKILLQSKMLAEAVRILGKQTEPNVRFFVSEELMQVGLSTGDTIILVRRTDGDFPNFHAIIPARFALQVSVHKESVIHSLKTALVVAKESSSIVTLHFSKHLLQIIGMSASIGENQIDIETDYEGDEERTISCNAKFLLDALNRIADEYAEFSMNEELKPLRLRASKREDFTYIVMPFKK